MKLHEFPINNGIRSTYENLHKELLYTDEQQNFDEAINAFMKTSNILENIGE